MRRTPILSFVVIVAGIGALLAGTARSQFGQFKNNVGLQPTTPGVSQSGNANISGTMRAGSFTGDGTNIANVNAIGLSGFPATSFARLSTTNVFSGGNTFSNAGNVFTGNGAGLTSVNADLLDGLNSTAFLQAIPNPLILSGAAGTSGVAQITNTSNASLAVAIRGTSTATSAQTIGGLFENFSTGGVAVQGASYAGSGTTTGVLGQTFSTSGVGVNGSGPSLGVLGNATGNGGYGVYGFTNSTTGIGVKAENANTTVGTGLFGIAGPRLSGAISSLIGVFGEANGTGSMGVQGFNANDGVGVFGRSSGSLGAGIVGQGIGGAKAGFFNGDVEVNGHIDKDYGSSTHQAVPIAYGTVNSAGTVVNGSGNWTVAWSVLNSQYEITITGSNYTSNMTAIVTPIANSVPRIGGVAPVGTDLGVTFFSTAGAKVQVSFHFVVYDPQ